MTAQSTGTTRLLSAGAVLSAVVASLCCIGPVALALLGLSGGAVLLRFEPYRPYLLAVTAGFLGAAFYVSYRPPVTDDCAGHSACSSAAIRTRQKFALWIVTAIVLLAATFPYFSNWLL